MDKTECKEVLITAVELGARVREERTKRRLTVEGLAFRAGITPAHISRLERGLVADPGYTLMSRIAVALGFEGADAMMGRPVVTLAELGEIIEERYGFKPVEPYGPDYVPDEADLAAAELERLAEEADRRQKNEQAG
ncbi:MAG: helix-turn-helix domain-containing protein [Patescibacteria group bacterium]|nr:helix-turn-helix domain-containing protein [Patescibacteria group bacterium]